MFYLYYFYREIKLRGGVHMNRLILDRYMLDVKFRLEQNLIGAIKSKLERKVSMKSRKRFKTLEPELLMLYRGNYGCRTKKHSKCSVPITS